MSRPRVTLAPDLGVLIRTSRGEVLLRWRDLPRTLEEIEAARDEKYSEGSELRFSTSSTGGGR